MCAQKHVEGLEFINSILNAGQFRASFQARQLESGIAIDQELVPCNQKRVAKTEVRAFRQSGQLRSRNRQAMPLVAWVWANLIERANDDLGGRSNAGKGRFPSIWEMSVQRCSSSVRVYSC
jgi:hypothetical protein